MFCFGRPARTLQQGTHMEPECCAAAAGCAPLSTSTWPYSTAFLADSMRERLKTPLSMPRERHMYTPSDTPSPSTAFLLKQEPQHERKPRCHMRRSGLRVSYLNILFRLVDSTKVRGHPQSHLYNVMHLTRQRQILQARAAPGGCGLGRAGRLSHMHGGDSSKDHQDNKLHQFTCLGPQAE